jgi:hypothetical protein
MRRQILGLMTSSESLTEAAAGELLELNPEGTCTEFYGGTHCIFCDRPREAHGLNLHPVQRMADHIAETKEKG